MPHGTSDWGFVGPVRTLFGLDDLGDHAVRIGAVSSWDRRGRVIFSDNFREGPGAWTLTGSDVTATTCLFTGHALSSPFCMKLRNGSGGAQYARMQHTFGYEYRGHAGLEFSITLEPGARFVKFGLFSSLPTGRLFAYVRFTPATGVVDYGSDLTGWTPFGNVGTIPGNVEEWHNIKLVADFDTGYYVKLVWEGVPLDMSAILCDTAGAMAREYWSILIENDNDAATQHSMYVDDVIVTIDEP